MHVLCIALRVSNQGLARHDYAHQDDVICRHVADCFAVWIGANPASASNSRAMTSSLQGHPKTVSSYPCKDYDSVGSGS